MAKVCAAKDCNRSDLSRLCDGCGKSFCEDCWDDFESDYETDYSDPEYPGGTMLSFPKKYCDKCAEC
jgi:hypothetical protein